MDDNFTIKSIEEWAQLPEVNFPQTEYANQKGLIYEVKKTGGLWVDKDECKDIDIDRAYSKFEKYLLPTIVVSENGQDTLMRLPVQIGGWVANCLELTVMGNKLFPSQVEFCIFNGKTSIEFILN